MISVATRVVVKEMNQGPRSTLMATPNPVSFTYRNRLLRCLIDRVREKVAMDKHVKMSVQSNLIARHTVGGTSSPQRR